MKDPRTSHSPEVNHAPLQRGLRTGMTYYEWFAQPEQDYQRRRFGVAMKGVSAMEPPNLIINGVLSGIFYVYNPSTNLYTAAFDWKSLPDDSPIVDVGGGIGNSVMAVLKTHPQLCAIVQDIPVVVEEAAKVSVTCRISGTLCMNIMI
jgi:hypothetical protein